MPWHPACEWVQPTPIAIIGAITGLTTPDELAPGVVTDWQSLKGICYTERKFWGKLISAGDIRVQIPHQANAISLSDWLHKGTAREEVEISVTATSKEPSGKKVRFDLPK